MILASLAIFLTFTSYVVGYVVGKEICARKNLEEKVNLSLLASLWATTDVKSIKNGVVVQRIVERFHPKGGSYSPEELKKAEEAMSEIINIDPEEFIPKRSADFREGYDFDVERSKDDPADLV